MAREGGSDVGRSFVKWLTADEVQKTAGIDYTACYTPCFMIVKAYFFIGDQRCLWPLTPTAMSAIMTNTAL